MRVKNRTPYLFAPVLASREPPKRDLALVVRGRFELVPGGVMKPTTAPQPFPQGKISGAVFGGEGRRDGEPAHPNDLAEWKPRADVLLFGTAHAPGGLPVKELGVRFAVGGWSKILRVLGPRAWSDGGRSAVLSEPIPFSSMRLSYGEALGGPSDPANPIGKGREGTEGPRVEHPGEPIRSRADHAKPAGFGPLAPDWSERRAKLGQNYGPEWRRTRAPHFATDFDFGWFNEAPADQQIAGYLRGDEEVLLQNVHREIPVLKTRLPGERVRAFVRAKGGAMREVAMVLDTLTVDADEGIATLVWRGITPAAEHDASDLELGLVASEPLDEEPRPASDYLDALEAFSRDPLGMDNLVPAELRGFLNGSPDAESAKPKGTDPVGDLLRRRFGAATSREEEKIRNLLVAASALAGAKVGLEGHLAKAANDVAAAKPEAPPIGSKPGAVPSPRLAPHVAKVEAEAARIRASHADRRVNAPELAELERLHTNEQLRRMDPSLGSPATARPAGPPQPGEALPGVDLRGANLEGLDLSHCDFTGALLDGANLRKANLRGAKLERATLFEADLEEADLSATNLFQANLSFARGDRARFDEARLDQASFESGSFAEASFAGAAGEYTILRKAKLDRAKLGKLRLVRSIADGVEARAADFREAWLEHTLFYEAVLEEARFDGATLDESGFTRARVARASFAKTKARITVWLWADIAEADFAAADLARSFFNGCEGLRARFRGANLPDARFVGSKITEADFTGANLFGADLSHAGIARARFERANLYGALLHGAGGEGVNLRGANLKRSSLENA